MSRRYQQKYASLGGMDFSKMSKENLDDLFNQIIEKGLHGLSFSAYMEGQEPGDQLNEDHIRLRMEIIKPYTKWIRSFSTTEGNEFIPKIAKEMGIKTLVGAWIGTDEEKNEEEIQGLINLAKEGFVDIMAVGNEVLLREDLSEYKLIETIERVKREVPGIPVAYVDAYYLFANHPKVADVSDIIMTNCYPFWEGYSIEHAFVYFKEMVQVAKEAAKGKPVIISETGWPDLGTPFEDSVPSYENALRYFINIFTWAEKENMDVFYFSSFDEDWKSGPEGDVGASWGLWDKNGNLKYGGKK